MIFAAEARIFSTKKKEGGMTHKTKQGTFLAFYFCCSSQNPRDNSTAIYKTKEIVYNRD